MTLVAEHNGILARIREDLPDVGCYLYIMLPTGKSKDHLQDTKEIAILQAEKEYDIPRTAWHQTQEIYIYLLNEGTDAWRPVDAIVLGEGIYEIPRDAIVPEDEDWEFLPGSMVRCAIKRLSGRDCMTAIEAKQQDKTEKHGAGNSVTL